MLNILPKYTNKLNFYAKADILDSDYSALKTISYISDIFLIIAWLIASFYNKSHINTDFQDEE